MYANSCRTLRWFIRCHLGWVVAAPPITIFIAFVERCSKAFAVIVSFLSASGMWSVDCSIFINQVTSTLSSKITCGVEIVLVLHFSHDLIILFSEHYIHVSVWPKRTQIRLGPCIFRLAVWIHRKFISGAFRWWNSMCWNMIFWKQDVNHQTPEAMPNLLWIRMEYERDALIIKSLILCIRRDINSLRSVRVQWCDIHCMIYFILFLSAVP